MREDIVRGEKQQSDLRGRMLRQSQRCGRYLSQGCDQHRIHGQGSRTRHQSASHARLGPQRLQAIEQVLVAPGPLQRIGVHHLADEMAQPPRCSLGRNLGARGLAMELQHGAQVVSLKRHAPREQLVEGYGQRVHVAAHAGAFAGNLFGRRIVGRAHESAGTGICGRGHAKIRDLDGVRLLAGRNRDQQQVRRLDVPVDHAAPVGGGQSPRGLDDVFERLAPGQRAFPLDVLGQRAAWNVLHREVGRALEIADVVDGHDAGVLQAGLGLRFHHQPADQSLVAGQLPAQHLDGHRALQ